MVKLFRYDSFVELKSAGNLTRNPDLESYRQYEALVDILRQSHVAKKTLSTNTKPGKNKKGNE